MIVLSACVLVAGIASAAPRGSSLGPELDRLLSSGCVPYLRFRAVEYPRAEVRAAVQKGYFRIDGDEGATLRAPVDWRAKGRHPLPSFRGRLQKMRFLDVLFYAYEQGSERALRRAVSLGVDWSRSHLREDSNHDPSAFHHLKTTGDRLGYLANLTRLAACKGELTRSQAEVLVRMLIRHGELMASRSYPSNQSLYQDIGLLLLASRYLPFLPQSDAWERLARSRFPATMKGRLGTDGIWQEHSVTYHYLVIEAATRFLRAGGPNAEVSATLRRMQSVAPWLVAPGGRYTQLGDTDFDRADKRYRKVAHDLRGLKLFGDSGFAVVRGGPRDYLAVTAQFHNRSHKQQDELTFELYENGRRIVAGPGRYGYGDGRRRKYTLSARSHSVLTVDGKGFSRDPGDAYGSAIVKATKKGESYVIVGRNPLLRKLGVRHRRTFVYEPGEALVIEDVVHSNRPHRYARFLQLGPEIDIDKKRRGKLAIRSGKRFSGCIVERRFVSAGGKNGRSKRNMVRGRRQPLQGFTFPEDGRKGVPRWSIAYSARGSTVRFVTVIDLHGHCPRKKQQPDLPDLPGGEENTGLDELLEDLFDSLGLRGGG